MKISCCNLISFVAILLWGAHSWQLGTYIQTALKGGCMAGTIYEHYQYQYIFHLISIIQGCHVYCVTPSCSFNFAIKMPRILESHDYFFFSSLPSPLPFNLSLVAEGGFRSPS